MGRTLGPFYKMGTFLVEVFQQYNWRKVVVISSKFFLWPDAGRAILQVNYSVTLSTYTKFSHCYNSSSIVAAKSILIITTWFALQCALWQRITLHRHCSQAKSYQNTTFLSQANLQTAYTDPLFFHSHNFFWHPRMAYWHSPARRRCLHAATTHQRSHYNV